MYFSKSLVQQKKKESAKMKMEDLWQDDYKSLFLFFNCSTTIKGVPTETSVNSLPKRFKKLCVFCRKYNRFQNFCGCDTGVAQSGRVQGRHNIQISKNSLLSSLFANRKRVLYLSVSAVSSHLHTFHLATHSGKAQVNTFSPSPFTQLFLFCFA